MMDNFQKPETTLTRKSFCYPSAAKAIISGYKRHFIPLSLLALSACHTGDQCKVSSFGDLIVINDEESPVIEAEINGHKIALIVDTGAQGSILWPGEAKKLGLAANSERLYLRGSGGYTSAGTAVADTIHLGSAAATNVSFMTTGKTSATRVINGRPVVGLFGNDFLSNYDVVFNLPQHRMNLYTFSGCKEDYLLSWSGWSGEFFKIRINHPRNDKRKTAVPVKINGHEFDAVLDSGAATTLISRDDALKAGISKSDLTNDQTIDVYGIDQTKRTGYLHRVNSLEVGPFIFNNPEILIQKTPTSLLGANFLRTHRVWIPRAPDYIYIQPAEPLSLQNINPATQQEHTP